MFELRLVTLDHYLAAPSAPLDPLVSKLGGWEVWQVPVLRIFGVTPAGKLFFFSIRGVSTTVASFSTDRRSQSASMAERERLRGPGLLFAVRCLAGSPGPTVFEVNLLGRRQRSGDQFLAAVSFAAREAKVNDLRCDGARPRE